LVSPVRLRLLDLVKDGRVVQVGVLEKERLAHMVIGQIPEVFQSPVVRRASWLSLSFFLLPIS
jgi:hypothetical protein